MEGLKQAADADRSIKEKYHEKLWLPFIKAIREYRLIDDGDRIAVCISGGKDSMLLAKLMRLYKAEANEGFELEFIVMDPGYNAENRRRIELNAEKLGIPLHIFETNIFNVAYKTDRSPCYLCAKMRRGHLYAEAQRLGCNKIALGHHFDDVVETTVMAMLYSSQLQAMQPKLRSRNFDGMELIRPLYGIREKDIIAWRDDNGLEFLQCACRFTENLSLDENDSSHSKRYEIKKLLERLDSNGTGASDSVFKAIHRLHIDDFPAYKAKGKDHLFPEKYIK